MIDSGVERLEVGVVNDQFLERELDVCECQLAEKRRLANAGKLNERGEFVAEHGCLELFLAIVELLHELVGLVQVKCSQLSLTFLNKCQYM